MLIFKISAQIIISLAVLIATATAQSSNSSNSSSATKAKPVYSNKDCEIVLLVDRFLVDSYRESTFEKRWEHVQKDIWDAMVRVNRAFTKQFNVGLPVVRVSYVSPQNELGTGLSQPSKNLGEVLSKFSAGVGKNQGVFGGIKSTCLAILLTFQNTGTNLGTAFMGSARKLGGICDRKGFNIGVANAKFGSREVSPDILFGTLAHEFGHGFGASHDEKSRSGECNPPGNPFIMYPIVTGNGENKERFSTCSQRAIVETLKARVDRCFKPRFSVGYLQHGNKVPVY